jgi:SAM-dependent methyltransferase
VSGSERGWSDYWQKDGAKGEVFVNAQGERHPALADFWRQHLGEAEAGERVIDLASGAGSVYAHLPEGHGFELFAADISSVALEALKKRFDGVTTLACSADKVPLDDASFDLVISQFGIEYAGLGAFAEAARLVAPGGRLVALCHVRDGYIDSGNSAQLREAKLVLDVGFVDAAVKLAEAAFGSDAEALRRAEAEFVPVAQQVGEGINRCKKGIHTYLYFGFRELYEKRQQYDLTDITGWLDGMRGELDMNVDRLSRMCKAALSAEDTEKIHEIFEAQGLEDVHCTPFETLGNKLPVAWNLSARRGRKTK